MAKLRQLFVHYFQSINYEMLLEKLVSVGLKLILTTLLLTIIYRIIYKSVAYYYDRMAQREEQAQRQLTLKKLVLNIIQYTYYFVLIYSILALLGIPVATLMAGAGVASVAIGIGAQGLVNDIVNGFFILMEHQFDVKDAVIINGYEGEIHALGMRTTVIKDWEGQMHFISNRNITDVSNLSRYPLRIDVDLQIYPDTDTEKMLTCVDRRLKALAPHELLAQEPNNLGVYKNSAGQLIYRVRLFAMLDDMIPAQATYYREIIDALKADNIPIPGNQKFLENLLEARISAYQGDKDN